MKKKLTRQEVGRLGGLAGKGVSRMTSEEARERANISWRKRKQRQGELERKAEAYDVLLEKGFIDKVSDIIEEMEV